MFHTRPPRSTTAGLARSEILWILGLALVSTLAILWTLRTERERAFKRHAHDGLEHLRGMIEMLDSAPTGDHIWAGTGKLPLSIQDFEPLTDLLGEFAWTGPDPWGGSFILRSIDGAFFIQSGGSDSDLETEGLSLPITR
ncbi:MAG: hypothetical protein QGH51_07055 [Planctomycetota bacterium]|nr:hypothetical protein [Planctomycetota bacterium]